MFYDTSASPRPRRTRFLELAVQPWRMLAGLMTERRARVTLSNFDDHMLKDIGLSRGGINDAVRNGRSGQ